MPQWTDGWQLGEPDLVVSMTEPFYVGSEGSDIFRTFVMPLPVGPMRYVKALEFKPSSGTVHHANIKIDRTRSSRLLDERDPLPGYEGGGSRKAAFPDGHFLGWTPGQSPRVSPMTWRGGWIAGSDLVIEAHLVPSKRRSRSSSALACISQRTPPARVPYTIRLSRQDIDIAPGARVAVADGFVLPVDVDVLGIQPHAHYLATEVRGFATLPDGTSRDLILIKDWDFHWQDSYRYTAPMRLRGARR